jgi:hypothetical protein
MGHEIYYNFIAIEIIIDFITTKSLKKLNNVEHLKKGPLPNTVVSNAVVTARRPDVMIADNLYIVGD